MTTLELWISQACHAFELEADFAYVVDLGNGRQVRAVARVRGLGARNGMLIVRNYEDVRPYAEVLVRAGYGYSVLDEPRSDEEFDLELFRRMFLDWGWSGNSGDRSSLLLKDSRRTLR